MPNEAPAILPPDELRAKAARMITQAAALPPADADILRNAAVYYLELAARLESTVVVLEAAPTPASEC
jgi:hypothetical protein